MTVSVTSPREKCALQSFQRARERWQGSPRTKLSPLPQPALTKASSKPVIEKELFAEATVVSVKSETQTSLFTKTEALQVNAPKQLSEFSTTTITTAHEETNPPAPSSSELAATNLFGHEVVQTETPVDEPTSAAAIVSDTNSTSFEYRNRLVAFYEQYNPTKLDTVDATLLKYVGKEDELFAKLEEKYIGKEGIPASGGTGPTCFLKFEFGNEMGRVEIRLFQDKTPLACENFRALCTGELSKPGKLLCYRKTTIHRIVPNMCIQGGDTTKGDGTGGESIYPPNSKHGDMWGKFKDEFFMRHDQKGLVSMANNGKNRNGSQFFVTLAPLPYLDGKHVVFGQVTKGMDVIEKISNLPTDAKQRPLDHRVVIMDCGEIRNGVDVSSESEAAKPDTTQPFSFAVAASKRSPFSFSASSNETIASTPISFEASAKKSFLFGGAAATTPFSFAAQPPTKATPFGFFGSKPTPRATDLGTSPTDSGSLEIKPFTAFGAQSQAQSPSPAKTTVFGFGSAAMAPPSFSDLSLATTTSTMTAETSTRFSLGNHRAKAEPDDDTDSGSSSGADSEPDSESTEDEGNAEKNFNNPFAGVNFAPAAAPGSNPVESLSACNLTESARDATKKEQPTSQGTFSFGSSKTSFVQDSTGGFSSGTKSTILSETAE